MTKLIPSQISGIISDDKIIVKDDNTTFREAQPSDFPTIPGQVQADWNETDPLEVSFIDNKPTIVTTIGTPWTDDNLVTEKAVRDAIQGNTPTLEKIETFVAAENIVSWQHTARGRYHEIHNVGNDEIYTSTVSGSWSTQFPFSYWQAFDWIGGKVKQLKTQIKISTASESGGISEEFSYNLTANIYNISWTYGTSAISTWAILLSSNTIIWTLEFEQNTTNPTLTFDWTNLPTGQYAIMYEWYLQQTSANTDGIIRFYWDNTGSYSGNAISWILPDAANDLNFDIDSDYSFAVVSDSSSIETSQYLWQALETKNKGESIQVKTRGLISEVWAIDWEVWYVSDTPGILSNTPGTIDAIVGLWKWTDTITLRWYADVYHTEIEPEFTTSTNWSIRQKYLSWGGVVNVASTLNMGTTNSLQLNISNDWVTRYTLATKSVESGGSSNYNIIRGSFTIPANHFVRLYNGATGWSTTINYLWLNVF